MVGYKFDRLKILTVDANTHARAVLKTILHAFGVTAICEAAEGRLAWEELCKVYPDIVFLDWQMPDMSGLEFTKIVRTSPSSPNPFVPIIMLAGHAQTSHVQRARDAGVTEILAKPISPKGILARMTTVIENPRSFVRTSSYFGPCRRRRNTEEYRGPDRRMQVVSLASAADDGFVVAEPGLQ
ncbi:MAG: response regulator [Rhizomicrobium sp.]